MVDRAKSGGVLHGVAAIFAPSDITLYVPCYNAGSSLGRCLDALLKQTIKSARLLIVDDGSDPPVDRLLGLSGVEIIRHDENRGLAAARNTALAACMTPLLASVDSDVAAEPTWLERLLDAINRENVAGVGGAMHEQHHSALADRWRTQHMAQHWGAHVVRNPRFLYGCNTLFRVEALRAVSGYDPRLRRSYEDAHVCAAIYLHGWSLLYEPAARCQHMRHDAAAGILRQFWTWHHPIGLLRGDFDSPAGVISRIEGVNFGIFRYRYDLDQKAGRSDLLGLDAAIPWVFCALDLQLHAHQSGGAPTRLPLEDLRDEVPEESAAMVLATLARLLARTDGEHAACGSDLARPCDASHLAHFRECLHKYDWRAAAPDLAGLARELNLAGNERAAAADARAAREPQCAA